MSAIFERTSIRDYKDKKVKKKHIKKLLKAAMQAPSARNQQPWEFLVVDNPALLQELSGFSPYGKPVAKSAVSIILLMRTEGLPSPEFAPQDMGAATENMLLEATELGLGAVWQGVYPNEDRATFITNMFKLPERIVPFAVVSLGWPAETREQQSRYDATRVWRNHYIDYLKEPAEIPEAIANTNLDSVHISQEAFDASLDEMVASIDACIDAAEAQREHDQERAAASQAAAAAAFANDDVFEEEE